MARKYVVSIDLNKNELLNARIQNLSSAPSSPVAGQIYYNTSTNVLYFYNGSEWTPTSGSTEVIQDVIGSSVLGGVGLTATYADVAGTTTIDLDNTAVTAGDYGSSTAIPTFTVDAQGRLTAAGEQTISTDLSLSSDSGTGTISLLSETLTVSGGEGIDTSISGNTITIAAEDATSSNKGIASFDSTDFTVASGNVTLNQERVEDIAAELINAGTGIDIDYNDSAGTLTINIDSTVATLEDAQLLKNKTLGAGTTLGSALDANNVKITNLADPVDDQDAANKRYVDTVAAEGLHVQEGVDAATTGTLATISGGTITYNNGTSGVGATLTTTGTFAEIDDVTLANGSRILVKDQADQEHNGIYVKTSDTVLTRDPLFDSDEDIEGGDFVFVVEGTVNAGTGWVQTNTVNIIGTDEVIWNQFSGAGTYVAGNGLTLTGTTFDVVAGTGIVANTNDVAINTSVVARKYTTQIGDGSATSYVVNHGLSNQWATVQIYEGTAQVEADVTLTDANNVTVAFAVAPTSNQFRVVVVA